MAEVGSTFVTVAPSTRGFGSKLDSQIGPEVQRSGKKAGGMFGKHLGLGVTSVVSAGVSSAPLLRAGLGELA